MKTARTRIPGSLVLLAALLAGACSAAAPSPSAIAPSPPPDTSVTSPPGGGGGGVAPGEPQPQFVVPRPGQLNVHPVGIARLLASVNGRAVTVQAEWYSGVEPCSVLDSVQVVRDGATFTVALFEGAGNADAACIEIAVYKATVFGLGDLEPGTYTIRPATGDAPPISVTVS